MTVSKMQSAVRKYFAVVDFHKKLSRFDCKIFRMLYLNHIDT